MKFYFSIVCFLIPFLVSTFTDSFAQTDWTKDEGNPVLSPGSTGTWNDFSLGPACILFDGSTYHMWYGGHDGTYMRIGYATSLDGISWEPYANNPVLDMGAARTWEDEAVYYPYVLFDGNTYHMWYSGSDGPNSRIGYATSPDRVTWTKYAGNPVMDKGPEGIWEVDGVVSPCILFDGSTYHMWYNGWDETYRRICYATSPDGITWIKYAGNPVLDMDPIGSWDNPGVHAPDVFFDGTKYHMWYTSLGTNWSDRIGYATSPDGITWEKYDDTTTTNPPFAVSDPVLDWGDAGSWDDQWVGFSRVLLDSATSLYKMWYTGGDEDWNGHIGYATAPDTITTGIYNELSSELPRNFVLMQNYPNPFNPSTTISYTITRSGFVSLIVYDVLGREVQILVNEDQRSGDHSIHFNASHLSSGVYFYTLRAGNEFMETRKMLLMR